MAINKYPYTNFNEYNLDWIIKTVKDLSVEWKETKTEWSDVQTEWKNYKEYIDSFFENLDLSQEVSDKINQMATDGYFSDLFDSLFRSDVITKAGTVTSDWISQNLMQETGYVIDKSLTVEDAAADAKYVGDTFKAFECDYQYPGFIGITGIYAANADYLATDYIECDTETVISLIGVWTGSSVLACAFYSEQDQSSFISGNAEIQTNTVIDTIPAGTRYVRLCSRISNGESPKGIIANYRSALKNIYLLQEQMGKKLEKVEPKNTTFFNAINYFDENTATLINNKFIDVTGTIVDSAGVTSILVPTEPSTHYIIYLPDSNRGIIGETNNPIIHTGDNLTLIYSGGHQANDCLEFTTGINGTYVFIYFNNVPYDYATYKSEIVLNKNTYTGDTPPYIAPEYLPENLKNPLTDKTILIFGDSITDCCNISVNSDDETTAYTWKNPSNSYVNEDSQTINYSMWPKILKENQPCGEIRNYAFAGASYKTISREAGYERQNVQYQIDIALNDIDNPNNVFSVNHFTPDIVIFALGTNDGTPADTYADAMNATVYGGDGVSIDVDATLAALNDTKTIASARKAFLRIKKAFPMAQIYCVLPIQRADNETNWLTLREYLSEMAERYGCIIIDGTAQSGITRDFNTWLGLGYYLKDGLHPNEKGQNLIARLIISELLSKYKPFGDGFNS